MKILDIIDFGNNGEGIAKVDGKVYFVPKAIKGEKVEAEVIKEKSNFCTCKLNKVVKSSPDRIEPRCKYYDICGGCNLQHMSYESQLTFKKRATQNTINKISKLNVEINDIMPSDKDYNYRNKMVFAINRNGKLCMHDYNGKLFEVDYCHLACEGINKILSVVQKFISKLSLKGYDTKLNKGLLRYLVVRQLNEEFLITLVATTKNIKGLDILKNMLDEEGLVYGLFVNINNVKGSLILTDNFEYICGLKNLVGKYKLANDKEIKYPISPASFMQVNDYIKNNIYDLARNELKGSSLIIDAYSGAGLMTAILSSVSDQVVGIEVVRDATDDANKLMKDNNITNMTNINADCVVGFDKVPKKALTKGFSVVLDPPRKGADQAVLSKVISLAPDKIVYISCNPATLARDLAILSCQYDITKLLPCDMFPNTAEVETFVTLQKRRDV